MKFVTAIIVPQKLEEVREALSSVGVKGLTVSDVQGFGRQKGHKEIYRGAEYEIQFKPKLKIEIAVPDSTLTEVIDVIASSANTGAIGAGKIFVQPLENVIRIRTGEQGEDAI